MLTLHDTAVGDLLLCKMMPEPHFAARKSLLYCWVVSVVNALGEGNPTARFH